MPLKQKLDSQLDSIMLSYMESMKRIHEFSTHANSLSYGVVEERQEIVEIFEKLLVVPEEKKKLVQSYFIEQGLDLSLDDPQKLEKIISSLKTDKERVSDPFASMHREMALTHAIAIFEAHFADILLAFFSHYPQSLKSNKSLTYEQVIEMHQSGNLVRSLAEKEVMELGYKSFTDKVKYVQNRLGISLYDSKVKIEFIVEIQAYRNLILHNNGIVNSVFQNLVPSSKYNSGDRVQVSSEFLSSSLISLDKLIEFLTNEIKAKCSTT